MWDYIIKGGMFMPALLACSVIAVAIMIERFIALRRADRQSEHFLAEFDRLVRQGQIDAARALCQQENHSLSDMMLAGIGRFEELRSEKDVGFVHDQVNQSIEEQGKHTVSELERYLGLLASIVTVAPLLGFAGTVTGMIRAFDAIAAANEISPALVASGISEALITTAAGLIIAMPSVVAFNWFTGRVESLTLAMESSANHLLGRLVRNLLDRPAAPKIPVAAETVAP